MKKLVKIVLFFFLVASMHGVCDAKEWESIRRAEKIADALVVAQTEEVEVMAQKGVIIITTSKPIEIKVFTILGQLVSQEKLPIGTSQLNIGSHGVYIVKVGEITCKVAL